MPTHDLLEPEPIRLESTPAAAPYSAAVALGDLVWTSDALPVEQDGSVPEDISAQVRTALAHLETPWRGSRFRGKTLVEFDAVAYRRRS